MWIIAQSPGTVGLLAALILAFCCLCLGAVVSYGLAYRYKQKYLVVARQLANYQGQNFRGELKTIGSMKPTGTVIPQPVVSESSTGPTTCTECDRLTAEKDGLVRQLDDRHSQLADQQQRIARLEQDLAERPTTTTDSTESWQLAQLHREQIAMQLQMDEYVSEIARLTAERDNALSRISS